MVALAGCGGGGSSATPRTAPSPTVVQPKSLAFVFRIPAASAQAKLRKPTYVSPGATGVHIVLVSNNGNTNASQDFGYFSTLPTTPGCTLQQSGAVQCAITLTPNINTPVVGTDIFTFTMYDAQLNTLSSATVPITVASTQSAPFAVTLDGVPHAVTVTVLGAPPPPGATFTTSVLVTATDDAGYIIIGPGNYTTPITLVNSDTSGATTLSTTTVTAPGQAVTLTYNGDPKLQYATITPSFAGVTPPSPQLVPGQLLPIPQPPYLYVSDYGPGGAYVISYPLAWLHDGKTTIRPAQVIATPNTVYFIAVDHAGNIYAQYDAGNGGILVYPPGSNGTPAPAANIPSADGSLEAFTADPSGNIFSIQYGTENSFGQLYEYVQPSYGATLLYLAQGNDYVNTPNPSIQVDAADSVFYTSNAYGTNHVYKLAGGQLSGVVSEPSDANGSQYGAVALDSADDLFVGKWSPNGIASSIEVYNAAAIAANTPLGTISSPATSNGFFHNSFSGYYRNAIAVDKQGYVYAEGNGSEILVFAPSTYSTTGSFGNVSVAPITDWLCCINPADPTGAGKLPVPPGVPGGGNVVYGDEGNSLAIQR